jgi:hypothetical protein
MMEMTREELRMPARQAEASIKACRAVELVRQGKTYDQIAAAVGFANRGTAHKVVTKALSERLIDGIDDLRHIELARLDALQAALWPRVEKGEVRAVNSVLRIIDRRCRILGLYPQQDRSEKSFDTLVMQDPGNPRQATGAQPTSIASEGGSGYSEEDARAARPAAWLGLRAVEPDSLGERASFSPLGGCLGGHICESHAQ